MVQFNSIRVIPKIMRQLKKYCMKGIYSAEMYQRDMIFGPFCNTFPSLFLEWPISYFKFLAMVLFTVLFDLFRHSFFYHSMSETAPPCYIDVMTNLAPNNCPIIPYALWFLFDERCMTDHYNTNHSSYNFALWIPLLYAHPTTLETLLMACLACPALRCPDYWGSAVFFCWSKRWLFFQS